MSYTFYTLTAKSLSYGSTRSASAIKYIVLHYTGNKTDTAKGNANYFSPAGSNAVKAGAHYFVDDTTVYQSIPDTRTAWAVGGSKYSDCASTGGGTMYGTITNSNSISIEMCSKNGAITDATIENAVALTKQLMSKYGIPTGRVYRHFDVNGKHCPGWTGWMGKSASKWTAFKNMLSEITVTPLTKTVQVVSDDGVLNVRSGSGTSYSVIGSLKTGQTADVVGVSGNWYKIKYRSGYGYISSQYTADVASTTTNTNNTSQEDDDMTYYKNLSDIPSYYKNAIQKLVDSGAMAGTGNGELNVSEDLCRMATVLNNAGILDLTAPTVYKTIDDVPSYYRAAVQKMIDRGAISGTGSGELNLAADR